MHKSTATHYFVEAYYGTLEYLHKALRDDWWEVQANWETFMDSLCRDGEITIEQYESWMFPWRR